jgi:drug/metabolite transporter (DMT)-like permease
VQASSPLVAGFAMTFLAAIFFLPFVIFSRQRIAGQYLAFKPLVMRGFFETAFMVAKLWALIYLSPQQVAAIGRVSLILTVIGGAVLYKEERFYRRFIASLLIFLGTILVVLDI